MPDVPPTIPPTKPAQSALPAATPADNTTPLVAAPHWMNPTAIGFAILAAILGLALGVLWVKLSARDTTIVQNKNHSDQVQDGAIALQAKIDADQVDTTRLQLQLKEAEANSAQSKSELEKTKTDSANLQELLDATRVASTRFQTQMEEAKVASIKHQGAVEVAVAQTTVVQTQLKQAEAERSRSDELLAEANRLRTDLETKAAQLQKDLAGAQARLAGRK